MRIGVPKEIKRNEFRVAVTPHGVASLLSEHGHQVLVEAGAGHRSGFQDAEYSAAGAIVVLDPHEVWGGADLIAKVKEPIPIEYDLIRPGQVLFTYLHLAADELLTRALLRAEAVGIAYETVQLPSGELPLLTPMSEVAGRVAIQAGARCLESLSGGRGVLLGGVPGVPPAQVLILGGGTVGAHAARIAAGMGAKVRVLDPSLPRLRHLSETMPANVELIHSNRRAITESLMTADLVIGAVLITGSKAPRLVLREDLKGMKPGSVIVDVAIDQGGCVETMRPTTHEDPVYEVDGILHYGVANIPGTVPRTSTLALSNATLPYLEELSRLGWREACRSNQALRLGLNVVGGQVVYAGVANAFGLPLTPVTQVLEARTAPAHAS